MLSVKEYIFVLFLVRVVFIVSSISISDISLLSSMPQFLRSTTTLSESVAQGIQLALQNCQQQFLWDRWNCPPSSFFKKGTIAADREEAFVIAITSAGIISSVAKNCSRGDIDGCSCFRGKKLKEETNDNTLNGTYKFQGCSDNLDFSERVSDYVLNLNQDGVDPQAYVFAHNAEAGRLAVRSFMRKTCRCHGVSGACSVQTCWNKIAPLEEIAHHLRQKHNRAVRVTFDKKRGVVPVENSATETSSSSIPEIDDRELVYFSNSPNYCIGIKSLGWEGTLGRQCSRNKSKNISHAERKSCRNLCKSCGYKVRKQIKTFSYRCNCKFIWCCEVNCEMCTKDVEEYFCDHKGT